MRISGPPIDAARPLYPIEEAIYRVIEARGQCSTREVLHFLYDWDDETRPLYPESVFWVSLKRLNSKLTVTQIKNTNPPREPGRWVATPACWKIVDKVVA